jgi:hypothetical protein
MATALPGSQAFHLFQEFNPNSKGLLILLSQANHVVIESNLLKHFHSCINVARQIE